MDGLYENFINNAIKFSSEIGFAESLDTTILKNSNFTDIEFKDENFKKVKVGVHYAIAIYSRAIGYIDKPIDGIKYDTIDKFFSKCIVVTNAVIIINIFYSCFIFNKFSNVLNNFFQHILYLAGRLSKQHNHIIPD